MDIMIGCDPEVFIIDNKTSNFVPAAGYFPGTKKEPFKVKDGAIQVDGVALEFNIEPAKTKDEFVANVLSVKSQMEEMVRNVNPDWSIECKPFATFNRDVWKKVPKENKELGCDPDFESSKGSIKPNPSHAVEYRAKLMSVGAVRTGSGHIHIGWSENEDPKNPLHFEDCRAVANYFHQNLALAKFSRSQLDVERYKYYGSQGAFRSKSYGVELRSPGNTWIASPESIADMYSTVTNTFNRFIESL